jgi:hypothetical protein
LRLDAGLRDLVALAQDEDLCLDKERTVADAVVAGAGDLRDAIVQSDRFQRKHGILEGIEDSMRDDMMEDLAEQNEFGGCVNAHNATLHPLNYYALKMTGLCCRRCCSPC